MKKTLLTFLFVLPVLLVRSQDLQYSAILRLIHKVYPEIQTENKLIAVNFWRIDDKESRDANKAFNKAANVFGVARLKGGTGGFITIAVNTGDEAPAAAIALTKDGNTSLLPFQMKDVGEISGSWQGNRLFDAQGNEIGKDLQAAVIFNSISQLITR